MMRKIGEILFAIAIVIVGLELVAVYAKLIHPLY